MTTPVTNSSEELVKFLSDKTIVDLTVLTSPRYPSGTAIGQPFIAATYDHYAAGNTTCAPDEAIYLDHVMILNSHTGTHADTPPHTLPDITKYPDLPDAHERGDEFLEKVEVTRWFGPADVIDVHDLVGQADPGMSPIITVDRVKDWEAEYGDINPGDVVLFYTSWCDLHYKPFPEGFDLDRNCRFYKKTPGWPAPDAETMEYLMGKGVRCVGFDTVSTGSIQDDGGPHNALFRVGGVTVEKLHRLGELPPRGAYFMFMPIRTEGTTGGPGRAIAIF